MKTFSPREGVPGFRFAATLAGIKKRTGLDLGLILCETPGTAAGVFTKNRVKAAPVIICKKKLARGSARAVRVNGGNANACAGAEGLRQAAACCARVAEVAGISPALVLPASTGVIGVPLPADKIKGAVPALVAQASKNSIAQVASAMMTTDTFPKVVALQDSIRGKTVKVCGIAKGAGMIMPDMATMLAFIVTDAAVDKKTLSQIVREHVQTTFNRISVDGDMSTNDSVIMLASGTSACIGTGKKTRAYGVFSSLVHEVMKRLACMIVRDGEGATKLITVRVMHARTAADAKRAAMHVANSCLVKTAFFGGDYNWGRIMAALGSSGAFFQMDLVDIFFDGIQGVKNGQSVTGNNSRLKKIFKKDAIALTIDLQAGKGCCEVITCDLSYDYVKINADYTT